MSENNEFDPLDPDMLNDEYWETLYWEEELDFEVFINEKETNFDIHQFFKYVIANIVLGAKYEIMVENYDHSTVTEIIEYLKKIEGKGITRVYSSCLQIFNSDRNFYYDTYDGMEIRELEKNFNDKSMEIEDPCVVEIRLTGTEYEPDYDGFF